MKDMLVLRHHMLALHSAKPVHLALPQQRSVHVSSKPIRAAAAKGKRSPSEVTCSCSCCRQSLVTSAYRDQGGTKANGGDDKKSTVKRKRPPSPAASRAAWTHRRTVLVRAPSGDCGRRFSSRTIVLSVSVLVMQSRTVDSSYLMEPLTEDEPINKGGSQPQTASFDCWMQGTLSAARWSSTLTGISILWEWH
jgi:hypothetical protein